MKLFKQRNDAGDKEIKTFLYKAGLISSIGIATNVIDAPEKKCQKDS